MLIPYHLKDKRVKIWCEDVSNLTSETWAFFRVNQELFEKHKFKDLGEIVSILKTEN